MIVCSVEGPMLKKLVVLVFWAGNQAVLFTNIHCFLGPQLHKLESDFQLSRDFNSGIEYVKFCNRVSAKLSSILHIS